MEKKYSILVVDDEKDILEALYDTFVDKYIVHMANSAEEALEILKETHVDLIMSDQRMPNVTGVELLARVESEYPKLGKILLTGYSDLPAVVDAINKGSVDKYLSKPWDQEELLHVVLEVMNMRLKKAMVERKLIESQLVQNAKMAALGELVAGIAHELNNPLGFIYANLGNMKKFYAKILALLESYESLDLPEDAGATIKKTQEDTDYAYLKTRMSQLIERSAVGADRMKKIIQDLKTFSRLDQSEYAEADINEAIETTLGIMTNEYKNRIEIIKKFGEIPPVECFIAKLNQVFMNLLINACHAIEGNGEITIKTGIEDERVKIEISDTGKGIPDDVKDKIFDPFFTTKAVGVGTGLGLSISHGIIKQHNGEISVQSKEGEGTTFVIKIPLLPTREDLTG